MIHWCYTVLHWFARWWGELGQWIWARLTAKFTVIIHFLLGLLVAFLFPYYPELAILLFIAFGALELWESVMYYITTVKQKHIQYRKGDDGGYTDFLDMLAGTAIGALALLIQAWIGG